MLGVWNSRNTSKGLKRQRAGRAGGPSGGRTQPGSLCPTWLPRQGQEDGRRQASLWPHSHPLCQMGKRRLRAVRPSWEVAPLGLDLGCKSFPSAVFQTLSGPYRGASINTEGFSL